jgi:HEAT repeat protein
LTEVDFDLGSETRWALTRVRGRLADPSLNRALTLTAVADPSPPIRYEALRWLLDTSDQSQVASAFVTFLDSEQTTVRWGAAVALATMGRRDGLDLLHEGVRSSSPWQRQEAMTALARVHDENTVRTLAPLIVSPVLQDRTEVVLTLGQIGGAEAYLLLLGSMNDSHADVRWRACMALGQLGDRRAIFPLKKLLTLEYNPKVRQHAEKAIHKLEAL